MIDKFFFYTGFVVWSVVALALVAVLLYFLTLASVKGFIWVMKRTGIYYEWDLWRLHRKYIANKNPLPLTGTQLVAAKQRFERSYKHHARAWPIIEQAMDNTPGLREEYEQALRDSEAEE